MSRIGKKPVPIPAGVSVAVEGRTVRVKGPKGELSGVLPAVLTVAPEKDRVVIGRTGDGAKEKALHGLWRALVRNMVEGAAKGYHRTLDIQGVGYQAKVEGGKIVLQIGFSHPVVLPIPAGLTVEMPSATRITVRGCDRQKVGQFAADIRRVRPPEPYKEKGIRYEGEVVKKKEGKTAASTTG